MHSNDPDFVAKANHWQNLAVDEQYETLVDVAIKDKIELSQRYKSDSPEIEYVLNMIHLGIEQLKGGKRAAGDACSFCGQRPPAVRLGAGGAAFICNECVSMFSEAFGNSAKS